MDQMTAAAEASPFEFSGGALCLDFVNTLGDRPRCAHDGLGNFSDLLRWAEEAGILDAPHLTRLAGRAARRPTETREIFDRAIALREALYRIFSAFAAGRRPGRRELRALNAVLAEALPHLQIEQGEDGFRWTWSGPVSRLDRVLWPVARSAADLITSPETSLLRECASGTCSWLFIDHSRTHRRRWCDMKTCGNRAKARRHYERRKRKTTQ
jgi:predicted RNA-binding Zn ribbon-like protein